MTAARGGKAVKVARETEGGATWEVEVIKTDGTPVDVLLDAQFKVISVGGEQEPGEASDDGD